MRVGADVYWKWVPGTSVPSPTVPVPASPTVEVPAPSVVPIPYPVLESEPAAQGFPWLVFTLVALALLVVGLLLCAALVWKGLAAESQEGRGEVPRVQKWLRGQFSTGVEPQPPMSPRSPVPRVERRAYLAGTSPATSTRPGIAADARQSGALEMLAVSVVGEGHIVERSAREDAYAASVDEQGCWLLAVGDGVSGSTDSHLAANAAVNLAVSLVDVQTAWHDVPVIVSDHLKSSIDASRGTRGHEEALLGDKYVEGSPDPKSTLTLARVVRADDGSLGVDLAAVGNSSVLLLSRLGQIKELLRLRERRDGSTAALPSRNPDWQLGHASMRACDCLVICSDGFERVYAENEELFREIIFGDDSPWSRLSALVALLASPAQGEYDDRTVVLLRPAAESE